MISKIHWINEDKIGEKLIGTMARPRGNDWLNDEIKGLKFRDVSGFTLRKVRSIGIRFTK